MIRAAASMAIMLPAEEVRVLDDLLQPRALLK